MFNEKYTKIIEIAKRFNGEIGKEIEELLSNLTYKQKLKVLNGENFSRYSKNRNLSNENYGRSYKNNKKVFFEESFLELETTNKDWRLELVNFNKDWVDEIATINAQSNFPSYEGEATDIFSLTVYDYDENQEISRIVEHTLDVCKNEDGYYLTYTKTDEPIKQAEKLYSYEGENAPILQNGKVVRDITKVPTRAHLIYAMTHKPKFNNYDLITQDEINGKKITCHDYHELDNNEDINMKVRKISKNQLYAIADLPCALKFDDCDVEDEEESTKDMD